MGFLLVLAGKLALWLQLPGGSGLLGLAPLLFIFAIFYFLLILPQQRKQKKWQAMLNELKTGDKIVTSGGLRGTIISLKDDAVTLRVPPDNLKMEVSRGSVVSVSRRKRRNSCELDLQSLVVRKLGTIVVRRLVVALRRIDFMNKNLTWKWGVIAGILVLFVSGFSAFLKIGPGKGLMASISDRIHLGLDLRGGTHLILQVQVNDAVNVDSDNAVARLKEDMRTHKITYADITKPDPAAIRN